MGRAGTLVFILTSLTFHSSPVLAVIDTDERLVIAEGEVHTLSGEHVYATEVWVVGTLLVEGSLHLIAPLISVSGHLNADAAGHEGGEGGTQHPQDGGHGGAGEGAGARGSQSSNGNAGGGGGGGGSYGGLSQQGGHGGDANDHGAQGGQGGAAGGTYGVEDGRSIEMGSGGGGGGAVTAGNRCYVAGEPGGAGGGAIHLDADEVSISGTVSANGGSGGDGQNAANCWNHGSGGGGGASGGGILIEAVSIVVEGEIQANGGTGGTGGIGDGDGAHGHRGAGGAGGGGGRIKLYALCREGQGAIEASGGSGGEGTNHDQAAEAAAGGGGSVYSEGDVEPEGCSGPPRIRLNGPYFEPEGQLVTLSSAGTRDPDEGQFDVLWSLDDDDIFDDGDTQDVEVFYADDGTYPVCLRAIDDQGEVAEACTEVIIQNVNPVILSDPPTDALEDNLWQYEVIATDAAAERDPLSLALVDGPVGMQVEGMVASWTPTPAQAIVGHYIVILSVEDDDGGEETQVFNVNVNWLDEDGDGMSDGWERQFGLDPTDPSDADEDTDGDGQSNLDEFHSGRDPTRFGRPDAPQPESPEDGRAVETQRPTLTVINATDPDGDVLQYHFELYADEEMSRLIQSGGNIPETFERTSWQVPRPLNEDGDYWWRARAIDGATPSDWSEAFELRINAEQTPPHNPSAVSPADGSALPTTTPTLIVTTVIDPDRDAVVYDFELYSLLPERQLALEVRDIAPSEEPRTSWQVDPPLEEDMAYSWRARARDELGLTSEWTQEWSFRVNSDNTPPPNPTPMSPSNRSQITDSRVPLVFRVGPDEDGDPLTYEVELDLSEDFSGAERYQLEGPVNPDNEMTGVGGPILQDNTEYFWRVRISDGLSTTDWSGARFLSNRANDPPGAPDLISPIDGEAVALLTPELRVSRAADPDLYDTLSYRFEIAKDDQFVGLVGEDEGISGDDEGARWTSPELEIGLTYYWRARAADPLREIGPWSEIGEFKTVEGVPPKEEGIDLIYPIRGEETLPEPTLQISNLVVEEGQFVMYGFELASDDLFENVLISRDQIPAGTSGTTYLPLGSALDEGLYFWHVRANVDGEAGPWSSSESFNVRIVEDPNSGGSRPRSSGLCATAPTQGTTSPSLLAFIAALIGLRSRRRR